MLRRLLLRALTADHVPVTGATLQSPGAGTNDATAPTAGMRLVVSFEVGIR